MSLQHPEVAGDRPLIPRPERTPGALRAACAVVAPESLPAYDLAKDEALAEAVESGSLAPVHAYLRHWAALIEIERHPALAKAYHRAEYLARIATTPEEARPHLVEAGSLYRSAAGAVLGE
ncbi:MULTISPECIES: DUF6247 family protein [Streptomyces]|uniref:DUF6247 family protein n=1 Tax=Streptomyces TaxID=1883 RepID=UPI0018852C1C|nr:MULTISPECIES: DUF6247 family protein [Streptomyces]MBF8174723.1 hypothetical protein [Streptomyces olivaceus]MBZ6139434.1 hypothetical protein [Streptomyces olivaceus]MBZ6167154.1 hypothetical protein [Streptomyces olivaceus]MBZ6173744.1 hypothetical protein [Streptomyces olivaceus]MBZ6179921.1 hypothetical protein [Streptomyces olivaceus]